MQLTQAVIWIAAYEAGKALGRRILAGRRKHEKPSVAPSVAPQQQLKQTAIWIAPSLDAQIRITAEWLDGDVSEDGFSYRHPIPGTITELEIISCADRWKRWTEEMIDTSWFFHQHKPGDGSLHGHLAELTGETPDPVQARGYLRYPIQHPTAAEKLYTFFSMHRGQKASLPCGCSTFEHFDHENTHLHDNPQPTRIHHPHHSRQCFAHKGDDVHMTRAREHHEAYLRGAK